MSFIVQPANLSSVTGVLAVANGGTGLSVSGTSGNVLTSNGSAWVSAAAAGGITWQTKTTTYTAVSGDYLLADTTSAAFTITLPLAPAANAAVYFQDAKGTFGTNNLTVARNGQTIMGVSEDLIVSADNYGFGLIYNGSDWRIF